MFPGLGGIDPDLAWDDDGTCYLTYCALDEALRPADGSLPVIAQARVDLERGILLEKPREIWRGSGLAHPEGPHLYRRGEWWYLLTAEGGTERGHAVCVARSRAIDGPFEPAPANPIFSRRSTGFPVQNTGHADLVARPDGEWSMVYLGVRPRGFTPGFHVAGRETFLAGIEWVGDWPVVHTDDVLPDRADTAFVDDFSSPGLHPRYVSTDGALPDAHPAGGVALGSHELAVRVRDLRWRFEARVYASAAVALRVRLDGAAEVRARIGPLEASAGSAPATGAVVTLVVEAVDATHDGPDDLRFGLVDADGDRWIAALDGRYLSTEVAGGFTGRTIGVRALGATAVRVTALRYTPLGGVRCAPHAVRGMTRPLAWVHDPARRPGSRARSGGGRHPRAHS